MPNRVKVTWDVDVRGLEQYRRGLPDLADNAVRKVALDLEADAKRRVPVRTGHLRSSITSAKVGDAHWRVTVGAEYGLYVEYGTRYTRAQPYFDPAVAEAARQFSAALAAVLGRA